jgi:two-component system sensor kinase FixL
MGLGLSICQAIVEAHGGTIRAVSSPLGGTCFRFTLRKDTGTREE